MIFSLSNFEKKFELPSCPDIDIICFFRVENAVHADEKLWWKTLTASLRGKRPVLILESNLDSFPAIDKSQRWQTSDNWCWLTPRSLSVISEAYAQKHPKLEELKTFLTTYKP